MLKQKKQLSKGNNKKLAVSYSYCYQLVKKHSNFYLGIFFNSKKKRDAIFSIYAWLRAIDDITDNEAVSLDTRLKNLNDFREKTLIVLKKKYSSKFEEKYWLAFRQTIIDYKIPISYLEDMITGQKQDLIKYDYQTFSELREYCRLVASVVGLILLRIWGCRDEIRAEKLAEQCGIALQLTNILRDITEDLALKRVYLPAKFFGKRSLKADEFIQLSQKEMLAGIKRVINLTQDYYNHSQKLYDYLPEEAKLSFLVIVGYYKEIFKKIQQNPMIILQKERVRLSKFQKIKKLLTIICSHPKVLWKIQNA